MAVCKARTERQVIDALARRRKLFQTKTLPLEQEIVAQHGIEFGTIVKKQMSLNSLILMNAEKKRAMRKDNLWIPPQNRVQTACLKNVFMYDQVKTTTHEGVHNIGNRVYKRVHKYREKVYNDLENRFRDFERYECKKRLKLALENQKICQHEQIEELYRKYEKSLRIHKRKIDEHYKTKCDKLIKQVASDSRKTVSCFRKIKEQHHNLCDPCDEFRIDVGVPSSQEEEPILHKKTDTDDILPRLPEGKDLYNRNMCSILHIALCAEKFQSFKDENILKVQDYTILCTIKNFMNEIREIIVDLMEYNVPANADDCYRQAHRGFTFSKNLIKAVNKIFYNIDTVSEMVNTLIELLLAKEQEVETKMIKKVTCTYKDALAEKLCRCSSSSTKSTSSTIGSYEDDCVCPCGCVEEYEISSSTLMAEDEDEPIERVCKCPQKCYCEVEKMNRYLFIKNLRMVPNSKAELCNYNKTPIYPTYLVGPIKFFYHPLNEYELKDLLKTILSSSSELTM